MAHVPTIIFIILFPLLFSGKNSVALVQAEANYFEQGKQAAEQGDFKKALEIWLTAKAQLDIPQTRIGVAYIELATREKLKKYYKLAFLMYEWGLSAKKVTVNKKALRNVLERMKGIAGYDIYRKWDNLLEDNDPNIYVELKRFWKNCDLTPATNYNERLIEHWQRIAYSRSHFNRRNEEPYRADERAKIYVRYGPPDYKTDGFLKFNAAMASSYVTRMANTPYPYPNITPELAQHVVRMTRNFHQFPEYEVWVYYKTADREEKLVFIFGTSVQAGGYTLIESIEDFIPVEAFKNIRSLSRAMLTAGINNPAVGNISPALILQIMYYRQLSAVDAYFGDIFTRLSGNAIDLMPVSSTLARKTERNAVTTLQAAKLRAPAQASALAQKMQDIPMRIYTYRLLSAQNEPILAGMVESDPYNAFWSDYLHNYNDQQKIKTRKEQAEIFSHYQYLNVMQLYRSDGKLVTESQATPRIAINREHVSASLFLVPNIGEDAVMTITAKLQNDDSTSSYQLSNLPFPASLRGLGTARITQPIPLDRNPGRLQMGDLILGVDYRDSLSEKMKFPFSVANKRNIPTGKILVVHVEVYHLQQNANGFGELTLSYQISPKEGFWGFLDEDRDPLQLTLNLETPGTRYVENLQIKTRALPPGEYILTMTAADKQTGQKVTREFAFKIVQKNR